jgi:hypothetical protein
MIAQDSTEIFLCIGHYDNLYLDYLFGPGSAPVIPETWASEPRAGCRIPHFVIQEYGPFSIRRDDHMLSFATTVLALLLWQMDNLDACRLMKEALRGGSGGDDDW